MEPRRHLLPRLTSESGVVIMLVTYLFFFPHSSDDSEPRLPGKRKADLTMIMSNRALEIKNLRRVGAEMCQDGDANAGKRSGLRYPSYSFAGGFPDPVRLGARPAL